MPEALLIGQSRLSIHDVAAVSRELRPVALAPAALERIGRGRRALETQLNAGEQIYGVNTGVGGNIRFHLTPEQSELLQGNLMRHLSCATGQPLPRDVGSRPLSRATARWAPVET